MPTLVLLLLLGAPTLYAACTPPTPSATPCPLGCVQAVILVCGMGCGGNSDPYTTPYTDSSIYGWACVDDDWTKVCKPCCCDPSVFGGGPPPPAGCNANGACDGSETCSTCPSDCGACCSTDCDCANGFQCASGSCTPGTNTCTTPPDPPPPPPPPPGCSCGPWNGPSSSCGYSGPFPNCDGSYNRRLYWRICTPGGCTISNECKADPTCPVPPPPSACGAAGVICGTVKDNGQSIPGVVVELTDSNSGRVRQSVKTNGNAANNYAFDPVAANTENWTVRPVVERNETVLPPAKKTTSLDGFGNASPSPVAFNVRLNGTVVFSGLDPGTSVLLSRNPYPGTKSPRIKAGETTEYFTSATADSMGQARFSVPARHSYKVTCWVAIRETGKHTRFERRPPGTGNAETGMVTPRATIAGVCP